MVTFTWGKSQKFHSMGPVMKVDEDTWCVFPWHGTQQQQSHFPSLIVNTLTKENFQEAASKSGKNDWISMLFKEKGLFYGPQVNGYA